MQAAALSVQVFVLLSAGATEICYLLPHPPPLLGSHILSAPAVLHCWHQPGSRRPSIGLGKWPLTTPAPPPLLGQPCSSSRREEGTPALSSTQARCWGLDLAVSWWGLIHHSGCGSWGGKSHSSDSSPSQNGFKTICGLEACLPCFQTPLG